MLDIQRINRILVLGVSGVQFDDYILKLHVSV